jgi:MFS family permease
VYVAIYAATVAFLAYASVYAYRKPFTVAGFAGIQFGGISYQTLLIISQVIGYMLSKFYGIKFIAELKRLDRWKTTALLVGIAWACLLVFALVPPPYGIFCFLVNGFVLGFMWGIIFSYVEGRRTTDFIGSVMAISFIFAGGFTRSVAKWLMVNWSVTEQWMPFMTGLVFLPPLILFTWLLELIPAPDDEDIAERTARIPMNRKERRRMLKSFSWGIAVITVTYLVLTVMRDIRDNYMANIWDELGYGNQYSVFATTETVTSLVVLVIMCMLVFIRRNGMAFRVVHVVILIGFLIAGISSALFQAGILGGAIWMQLAGLGLYLAYIPFNCIFFERMIATFRIAGNVGFLIYFADAFGYLGSVGVMLSKELLKVQLQWSSFYSSGVVIFSLIGAAGTILSLIYFSIKKRRQRQLYA